MTAPVTVLAPAEASGEEVAYYVNVQSDGPLLSDSYHDDTDEMQQVQNIQAVGG